MSAAASPTHATQSDCCSFFENALPFTSHQIKNVFEKHNGTYTYTGLLLLCYAPGGRVHGCAHAVFRSACCVPLSPLVEGINLAAFPKRQTSSAICCLDGTVAVFTAPILHTVKVAHAVSGVIHPPLFFSAPDQSKFLPLTRLGFEMLCSKTDKKQSSDCENDRLASCEYMFKNACGIPFGFLGTCSIYPEVAAKIGFQPSLLDCLVSTALSSPFFTIQCLRGIAGICHPPLIFKKSQELLLKEEGAKEKPKSSDLEMSRV